MGFGRLFTVKVAKSIERSSRTVVGRRPEKRILEELLRSESSEFLAIYGRRRVGKTHLIREYCGPRCDLFFVATGQKDASTAIQLFRFNRNWDGSLSCPRSTGCTIVRFENRPNPAEPEPKG